MAEDKQKPKKLNGESLRDAVYIFKYIKPYRWYLVIGLFLLFLTSLTFMVFPFLAGQLIDIAQGKSKYDFDLRDSGYVLISLLLIQGVVSYFRVICFAQVGERGLADLRKALFDKLLSLPITFFEKSKSGELISRIAGDIEKLYSVFSVTLGELIRQIIILIVGIIFLFFTTPNLALIMLSTFPVIVIGAFFFGRYIRKLSKKRQEAFAFSNDVVSESIQSIRMVKAFTNEPLESKKFGSAMSNMVKIALKFASSRALFAAFIVSVLFGCLFYIIYQGALMIQNDTITAGDLVAFVSYTAIIGGAIAGLGSFYTELLSALGATERVRSILEEEPELYKAAVNEQVSSYKNQQLEIAFNEVNFAYPSRPDISVLEQFNLKINPGETIALVGASGAGKSTIIQLLLRFYNNYSGKILLGGKNIQNIEMSTYRRHFSLVPQEITLFSGTIRENIAYGKPGASEKEILEAAKKANALEYIERFPEGLDTIVGERGMKLSGGQRQRLAIARAIIANPSVIIMDEATSNLDSESERLVQDALDRLMDNRTSIVIAHRLSTVQNADRIFVLDNGRIVEEGSHDVLISKEGIYANLINLQYER